MFKSKKLAVLAALLSLLMLLSMMAVPVFADETTTADPETTAPAESEENTTAEDTSAVEGTTAGSTSSDKTEEGTTGESKKDAEEKKDRLTRSIINLSVGAVILIVLVILAIKFRSKIPTWWRGLKSECGKITWCPKDKLKKNTLVVVVIILAIAIAIGVLDFVFSRGMILLGDLFR